METPSSAGGVEGVTVAGAGENGRFAPDCCAAILLEFPKMPQSKSGSRKVGLMLRSKEIMEWQFEAAAP